MTKSKCGLWPLCRILLGGIGIALAFTGQHAHAQAPQGYLIKLKGKASDSALALELFRQKGSKTELVSDQWILYKPSTRLTKSIQSLGQNPEVELIQPNYKITLPEDYRLQDPLRRRAMQKSIERYKLLARVMPADNPAIPAAGPLKSGGDPDVTKQWGLLDIGAPEIWKSLTSPQNITVAVIDTGVDYTHEDLLPNIWRNPGESGGGKESNGIDDDKNGYVDDVVGWDFASNDRLPFDFAVDELKVLSGGGNPGHGTHCAGSIGARGENATGISGIGPQLKIMALRFISEKGSGTTADAVKAIRYAVDNGARVLSNSWGSEGEDAADGTNNAALREAIQYAESKNVLFIAAAGNGHRGAGYDNDSDPNPAYPASYPYSNIISVAALDANDRLGGFSNWGAKTVHIGAPGLNVYSTMVGGIYSDKVVDLAAITVDWDGTSMAAPHVAGAAAIYWTQHPGKTYAEVKEAILLSAKPIPALRGKVQSNGKLNLVELFKR